MADSPHLRPLVAEDAPALKACFERCYGPSYVAGYFYDLHALQDRIQSGRLRSIVAIAESGEIVGHMGLTVRHSGARTVDAGNTIVDPRFRGKQLVAKLGISLSMLCRDQGFLGYHHYPTTIHPIMQKLSVSNGGVETGIMLDYIPAGTEYREIEGEALNQRLAVTVVYQPLNPAPARSLHVPDPYLDLIQPMAEAAKLQRNFVRASTANIAPSSSSPSTTAFDRIDDPRRGLLRIEVREPGADLVEQVHRVMEASPADTFQLDLSLDNPATPMALKSLQKLRFAFCAYLPEYLEGDVLRLQRMGDTAPSQPKLANSAAQSIFDGILREFESLHE